MNIPLARILWGTLGVIAMIAGLIGAVLPVIPTTPFIILAAFAFSRSIPAVHRWLENNRIFGPMIADWRDSGAIAIHVKIYATVMMAASIGMALYLQLPPMLITVQAVCLAAAAAFVLTRPSA